MIGLLLIVPLVVAREVLQWTRGRLVGVFNVEMLGVYAARPLLMNLRIQVKRARLKHACGILLKHLRRAHCGYDLRGLPVDEKDSATVCPACGRGWRLHVSHKAEGHDNG